jgi:hypothetical protein
VKRIAYSTACQCINLQAQSIVNAVDSMMLAAVDAIVIVLTVVVTSAAAAVA